eukprot:scaffold391097_cov45-Prasinocladus_malaysianus.AAC.1
MFGERVLCRLAAASIDLIGGCAYKELLPPTYCQEFGAIIIFLSQRQTPWSLPVARGYSNYDQASGADGQGHSAREVIDIEWHDTRCSRRRCPMLLRCCSLLAALKYVAQWHIPDNANGFLAKQRLPLETKQPKLPSCNQNNSRLEVDIR